MIVHLWTVGHLNVINEPSQSFCIYKGSCFIGSGQAGMWADRLREGLHRKRNFCTWGMWVWGRGLVLVDVVSLTWNWWTHFMAFGLREEAELLGGSYQVLCHLAWCLSVFWTRRCLDWSPAVLSGKNTSQFCKRSSVCPETMGWDWQDVDSPYMPANARIVEK